MDHEEGKTMGVNGERHVDRVQNGMKTLPPPADQIKGPSVTADFIRTP